MLKQNLFVCSISRYHLRKEKKIEFCISRMNAHITGKNATCEKSLKIDKTRISQNIKYFFNPSTKYFETSYFHSFNIAE